MLGLALGGGAAKGYGHIGVIKVLEEEGVKPDLIVGASMGALVGGFYAAGFSAKELEEIACKVDKKTKGWLFQISLSSRGFVDGKNVLKFLEPYLSRKVIEQLPIKYAAVTTDVESEAEIIIERGDLIQAIRAAISIPVVFMPYVHSGHVLIDGGFVNPLPIDVVQKLGAKKIIAVNVLHKADYPQITIRPTMPSNKSFTAKKIFDETIALIFSRLVDYQVQRMKRGILINVDTRGIGVTHFEKAQEAIERGYAEADKQRKKLRQMAKG